MKEIRINIYNIIGNSFAIEADDGELIYKRIEQVFDEKRMVLLDFQNIEVLTAAFLNTSIGQLYSKYSSEVIKSNLSVENMLLEDMILLKRVVETAKLFYSDPSGLKKSIDDILGMINE
ncbi:MAG: DUF4325 domain-containing protein [Neisseriales bacterium]|nr:MAG: DUF4325 domain-containing protein [Neisseriales bacterium]